MTAAGQLYSDEAVSRHLAHLEELSMRQQARLHEIELRAERLAAQERSLGERMREAGTAADALAARERELAERERRLADAHDMIAKAEDWQLELAELERALDERTLAFGRAAAELDEREQRVRGLEMRETMLEHRIEEVAARESAATFSEAAAESWLAERADHEQRLVELDADADRRCSELEEREAAAHARSREVDLAVEEVRRRGAVVAHRETRLQSRATRLAHGETALSHSERAVRELLTQAEAALVSITDAELREVREVPADRLVAEQLSCRSHRHTILLSAETARRRTLDRAVKSPATP